MYGDDVSFDGFAGHNMKLGHDPSRSQTNRTVVDVISQLLRIAGSPVPAAPRTNVWWSQNKNDASSLTRLAWFSVLLDDSLASAVTALFLGILRQ